MIAPVTAGVAAASRPPAFPIPGGRNSLFPIRAGRPMAAPVHFWPRNRPNSNFPLTSRLWYWYNKPIRRPSQRRTEHVCDRGEADRGVEGHQTLREKTLRVIAAFHTTTDALAMEARCQADGVPGRLIPLPKEISAGCGLAWSAPPDDVEGLRKLLRSAGITPQVVREVEV